MLMAENGLECGEADPLLDALDAEGVAELAEEAFGLSWGDSVTASWAFHLGSNLNRSQMELKASPKSTSFGRLPLP